MTRAGTILVLLALAVMVSGCGKCGSLFGSPGVCRSDTPAVR